jgi:UDP-N-acetylglucosamine diphosphorylase/glucosamine-1-phosphate N-acetyltransferase
MQIILFDGAEREHLLPLTYTRPMGTLRWGILTIAEKWEHDMGIIPGFLTVDYLQTKYPYLPGDINLYLNGGLCPDPSLLEAIDSLEDGQALVSGEELLAYKSSSQWDGNEWEEDVDSFEYESEFTLCRRPYDLFSLNGQELERDFERLTKGRESAALSSTNTIIGDRIFLEEGASVEAAILNSTTGPIYIGKEASILEGSVVRGGLALCEHSQLKLSAKIYGPTTIGPHSKVGGEVSNCVIQGYSNKGHDGFMGNSVLGEWCNIGADTNTSNLKNNYDQVRLWSYPKGGFEKTGLQFCGLIMGDHSKCGINTMFNTGTVVGVSANIFGAGFPRNYIPSFTWGGPSGMTEYRFEKAMETAERVMSRRNIELDDIERGILQHIFDETSAFRKSK